MESRGIFPKRITWGIKKKMNTEERLKNWQVHDSIRGRFGYELYLQMAKNEDIVLIVGDLGYKLFDAHREDFPDRFINTGASEQAMMGLAVGLALEGKIPFVYSITTFLLYRPFETIRLYLQGEGIPVKLIGSGRDKDYAHDGPSHHSEDAKEILATAFPNIISLWPDTKEEIAKMVDDMVKGDRPMFISLRR